MTVRRGCDWKSVLLSTILVVLVAISIAGGTVAAQGEGFSLSPLSFETVLVAGKEDETQMTVKNMGSHPLSLKIYACDVIASAGVDGDRKSVV